MFRTIFALVAVVPMIAMILPACSSGDVAVGASNSELRKKRDGGATGDGKTCSWDETVSSPVHTTTFVTGNGPYNVGDTFDSPDGCNSCGCTVSGIVCTEKACAPGASDAGPAPDGIAPGATCKYAGRDFSPGPMPSLDNCNNFTCQSDGTIIQTEKACVYACPTEKVIDCMPMVPNERLALCYGVYSQWIGANCPDVVFAL